MKKTYVCPEIEIVETECGPVCGLDGSDGNGPNGGSGYQNQEQISSGGTTENGDFAKGRDLWEDTNIWDNF